MGQNQDSGSIDLSLAWEVLRGELFFPCPFSVSKAAFHKFLTVGAPSLSSKSVLDYALFITMHSSMSNLSSLWTIRLHLGLTRIIQHNLTTSISLI